MPDVGERLEKVEQGLTELGQRVDERFDEVKQRFDKVDGRFGEVDQRLDALGAKSTVSECLRSRTRSESSWSRRFRAIMERHFSASTTPVEPLKALQPLFEKVAKDHEQRITALERARR